MAAKPETKSIPALRPTSHPSSESQNVIGKSPVESAGIPNRVNSLVRNPTSSDNDLADSVRKWVHFDNLAENLNKQVTNARNLRSEYEGKILSSLEASNMKQAVIKINGATLQYATKYKQNDLGWTMLRDQLHEYYAQKGRPDETDAILQFLQTSRGGKQIPYLKKTSPS